MKKILLSIFILTINIQSSIALELKKYYQFPDNYFEGNYSESTKNFFLVTTNNNKDPRFKDAVVIMTEHNPKGALGFVINKPIGIVNLGTLMNSSEKKKNKKKTLNLKIPIFWGGPLDQNKIFVIHSIEYKNENTQKIKKVSISSNHQILVDIADQKGPKNFIIVRGLSAWNKGQLDGEIDKGMWNLSEIDENIIFERINKKKHNMATERSFIRL